MTVNELIDEVCALGFESILDGDAAFLTCANRALRLIFSERGVEGSTKILINNQKPNFRLEHYYHSPSEAYTLKVCGAALSFRYQGRGSYTLKSGTEKVSRDFSSFSGEAREFINGEAELCFFGPFSFDIFDLAVFDSIFDTERDSIPIFSERVNVDLRKRIPDLLSLSRVPTDSNGKELVSVSAAGGCLTVDAGFCEAVTLYYKRMPKKILIDSEEAIDIPSECEHLLPLLTASYLWLDDDAEKAQYYLALYREAMNQLKRYTPSSINPKYNDVLRWC